MEEEEDEKIDNIQNKEGIISESDLLDVYEFQYNDLFSKILKINEEKFFALLQEQVLLNLRIINKLSDLSLMSYFQDFISERYKTDKKKAANDIEEIKKLPEEDIIYLDYSNCYIHCHKNLNAFHKCLNKLVLYKGFIYCLQCNKVYNENQIKLYCSECDVIYFSKLRKNVDESNEFFFPVVFAKNHCQTEYSEAEKIKCLECGEDLYYDLSKTLEEKEKFKYRRIPDLIKELLCTKCKLIYDTREIRFTCSECESDFMSDAKLYNDFPLYRKKILYLVHTLRKDKLALPENFNGKKCNCDINLMKEFFHEEDNGALLEGHKDEKNKIVCEQCFAIFEGDKLDWKCPSCGEKFKVVKPNENNIIKARSRSRSNKYIRAEKRNDIKNENKVEIKKEIKDEVKNHNKIEIKNEIKDDAKNEEYQKKINDKKYIENNYNSVDNNKIVKIENLLNDEDNNDDLKNEEINNKNNERNKNNKRNIIINNYNSNQYNKKNLKLNNNYRNYNQINNDNDNNKCNYNDNKYNYRKINNQNKEEENKNNSKKDIKEVYKNISNRATKVIIDTKNNNNSNSISNKRYLETQKRKDYINNRNKDKNGKYNLRNNHQIMNINETSKKAYKNRNSAIIEHEKKEIRKKEIKDNKEKESKKNLEEFNNIRKYFEDFNVELEKDIENKNKLRKINKEKKDKEFISNKNLRIQINVDYKNRAKHNISNIHNINNIHNIYHFANNGLNGSRKKNYQYTDSNYNNIQKNKRQPNGSRENMKDKKGTKNNLSSNKIIIKDTAQNTSRRRHANVVNIKVNNYNKDNKDSENNNYNKQKQNIINNDKNEKNNNNKIYNKSDIYKNNNNKKEEEYNKNEIKEEQENKNDIKQEPVAKNEQNTYTQISINSNNYKNILILGQGSYGKIYLVEDTKTKEQYAMKKLILGDKLELRDNQDEYNMIMQITTSYPELNIIHVYGTETKNFDEYNFVFYVLMEVANCDWEKELLNRSRHQAFYTEEEIFYILQSLVDTFAYLQEIGICHRDIKPQNILCFGEKGYKISDFGEAKYRKKWRLQQQSVDYTSMQTVRGTELYMSPILYTALKTAPNKGANHNVFKSDVFSLGMCFLFAASLDYKSLYDIRKVNNMNQLSDVVNQYVNGRYSNNFMDILFTMLQINEKERPDFIELSSMI